MKRSLVSAGIIMLCGGCSLLQLDDFDLQACAADSDCYVLSHADAAGPQACYRCNAGRCEQHGALSARVMDSNGPPAWLSATNGTDETTLLALGAGNEAESSRGFELIDGVSTAKGAVEYTPESTRLLGLSLDWFAQTHLIGVTVDTMSCPHGRIRLGIASASAPFSLAANGVGTVFSKGVDLDATGQCTQAESVGARAPAVAAVTDATGRSEALVVWVAKSQVGFVAGQSRCARAADSVATIRGLPLALLPSGDDATFKPAGLLTSAALARDALDVSPPRISAITTPDAPGYVLAYVNATGVQLAFFPAFDDARLGDADLAPRSTRSLEDPSADQVSLAPGAVGPKGQTLLVVWSSACASSTQLRAAVFLANAAGLQPYGDTFTLQQGATIAGAPAVGYAPTGWRRSEPRGGRAVMWSESHGPQSELRASRIGEAAPSAETSIVLDRDSAAFPFVHTPKSAPFAYGMVAKANDQQSDLTLLSCDP